MSEGDWNNRLGVAERLLDAILPLQVHIDRVATHQLVLEGATSFTRVSTIVELHGNGHTGHGEDVAYSPDTQDKLPAVFAAREDLAGTWTLASLAEHLDAHPVQVPGGDAWDDKAGYHRWAVESAALDLALRQHGTDLAGLIGAEWQGVRTSLSMGLGEPPSAEIVRAWLDRDPSITFKLDVNEHWTPALVADLAALGGAVSTIDFKALYSGDWSNNDYPTSLYAFVAHGLPGALIEDAKLTDANLDALDEAALGRLAWDYPITKWQDIPGIEGSTTHVSDLRPLAINIKPSRFGSIEGLLTTIMRCEAEGIPCYSGGQFELGVGRTQVQAIASLCFPDAPNDCASVMYHGATPTSDDVPLGLIEPPAGVTGYGWVAPTRAVAKD